MTTHRNHYVPQWYQKLFVKDSKTPLYYLDLRPETTTLPSGETVSISPLRRKSPRQCFWEEDLYTTVFGNVPNDDIEIFLFGSIDNDGANAVRALLNDDKVVIHEMFSKIFEYLDAQKLRTPKGLEWIRSNYPKLNQIELMREMQSLRRLHCTMWTEAVREIVSAESSDVKFIISDNPVTVYNRECSPDSSYCLYPSDPNIGFIGSQTLFPLGPNHCLVLTNLEYANQPDRMDLLAQRQHARNFDNTIARTDAWIRSRQLSREDVISINHILKARAIRFVAAPEEAWLFPELKASDWQSLARVLLPPKNELWHFGGEIFIKYKDGSVHYQDAFGRTSKSHSYLQKKPPDKEPGVNDYCICGSGKSYDACCRNLPTQDRMPSDVYSIRERNLMLVAAIEDILGMNKGKSWEDVRRELSDEQVKEIHLAYASLWADDTNIAHLLPRPDQRVFRAVYVGLVDPRTIVATVLGWLRYFDEIIVPGPFVHFARIKPEFSPVESPSKFKEQTIRNVLLLFTLAPFIEKGLVHLVPDPMDFSFSLREEILSIGRQKSEFVRPEDLNEGLIRRLQRDDMKRILGRLPDDALRRQLRLATPDLDDATLEDVIKHIRDSHIKDPLSLIQPLLPGEEGAQFRQMRGINFELAVFLSQLTGAAIYTDMKLTRRELENARIEVDSAGAGDRLIRLKLPTHTNPEISWRVRNETLSKSFRDGLRRVWNETTLNVGPNSPGDIDSSLHELALAEAALQKAIPEERAVASSAGSEDVILEFDVELLIPARGFSVAAAHRFLVSFGRKPHLSILPLAICFGDSIGQSVFKEESGSDPG